MFADGAEQDLGKVEGFGVGKQDPLVADRHHVVVEGAGRDRVAGLQGEDGVLRRQVGQSRDRLAGAQGLPLREGPPAGATEDEDVEAACTSCRRGQTVAWLAAPSSPKWTPSGRGG